MQEEKVVEFISAAHKDIEGWFFPLDQIVFFELFIFSTISDAKTLPGVYVLLGIYTQLPEIRVTLLNLQFS